MNAYELGTIKCIPAVLVYLKKVDAEGKTRLLMLHRAKKQADYHEGKWNGLGGKMEPGETPKESAAREVLEESGLRLSVSAFKILGSIHFPLFKPSEDWHCTVLTAHVRSDEHLLSVGPEGELHWIEQTSVLSLNLWPGDALFLPHVFKEEPFMGSVFYENKKVVRHCIEELK